MIRATTAFVAAALLGAPTPLLAQDSTATQLPGINEHPWGSSVADLSADFGEPIHTEEKDGEAIAGWRTEFLDREAYVFAQFRPSRGLVQVVYFLTTDVTEKRECVRRFHEVEGILIERHGTPGEATLPDDGGDTPCDEIESGDAELSRSWEFADGSELHLAVGDNEDRDVMVVYTRPSADAPADDDREPKEPEPRSRGNDVPEDRVLTAFGRHEWGSSLADLSAEFGEPGFTDESTDGVLAGWGWFLDREIDIVALFDPPYGLIKGGYYTATKNSDGWDCVHIYRELKESLTERYGPGEAFEAMGSDPALAPCEEVASGDAYLGTIWEFANGAAIGLTVSRDDDRDVIVHYQSPRFAAWSERAEGP